MSTNLASYGGSLNRDFLNDIGAIIRDSIKDRIRQNKVTPSSNKNGGRTLVESSGLINSIRSRVKDDNIFIGTNVKYARIHHEGGTIRPVKAKYLAIPLTPAAKANRPRDFENTFIKEGIIYRKVDDTKIEALYVLKKEVKIPARPYMYIDSNTRNTIENKLKDWILKQLNKK